MTDRVRVDVDGAVRTVTLDRPEKGNAMDAAMLRELEAAFDPTPGPGPAERVAVIRAAGRVFCAGLDLKHAMKRRVGQQEPPGVTESLDSQRRIADIVMLMRRCPQPIVALIQGAAAG